MVSTLGQIRYCKALVGLVLRYRGIHLHASTWSRANLRQAEHEGSRLEESCSRFVRTTPEQAVYPEDRRSPATRSLRLPQTAQILAPRSTHSIEDPASFCDSICSRTQIWTEHSRRFREASAMGSWGSRRQLQYQVQSLEQIDCAPDSWIC